MRGSIIDQVVHHIVNDLNNAFNVQEDSMVVEKDASRLKTSNKGLADYDH